MIPHRWRLYAIAIVALLDVAALVATHYGVADTLITGARPLVEGALYALLAASVPALADACAVERRRRDPAVPALSDDVRVARCPMACPHGDRCTREAGHGEGCHHLVCPCNEPNAPLREEARS